MNVPVAIFFLTVDSVNFVRNFVAVLIGLMLTVNQRKGLNFSCTAFARYCMPVSYLKGARSRYYNTLLHWRKPENTAADPGIFLGGGASLRNGITNTNKPHKFFAEYQLFWKAAGHLRGGGGGGGHTPPPPPRFAPD